MICAELEQLEAELDDILTALEDPDLTSDQRKALESEYAGVSKVITLHQKTGHAGKPCFEECGPEAPGGIELP